MTRLEFLNIATFDFSIPAITRLAYQNREHLTWTEIDMHPNMEDCIGTKNILFGVRLPQVRKLLVIMESGLPYVLFVCWAIGPSCQAAVTPCKLACFDHRGNGRRAHRGNGRRANRGNVMLAKLTTS